jgi:TetR/AcrR family transcriptional regulator, regulator of cefoperazone and chloramphenicol sensitivity
MLNMSSAPAPNDLTARAAIREAALRLFAERDPDAVTVRQIASEAGVSPALVIHHFGNKAGLRAVVDEHVARRFEEIVGALEDDLAESLTGGNAASLAEAFVAAFPPDSAIPAYLRRLLLSNDPTGDAVFTRWFELAERLLADLEAAGVARPSGDRRVRAAFLLVNDLAALLLARQIERACGLELLTSEGMTRWAAEAVDVYARGAFRAPAEGGA